MENKKFELGPNATVVLLVAIFALIAICVPQVALYILVGGAIIFFLWLLLG